MTFILRNHQNIVKFNSKLLKKHVQLLRELMGVSSFDLCVTCENDKVIRELHKTYRGVDEPTDVLAFPYLETLIPGKLPVILDEEERMLGDIFLGIPYINNSCLKNSETLTDVLPVMVTHGICHLIGYDHEQEDQWKQMYQKELEILQKFNEKTGSKCIPLLGVGHYT